MPRPLGSKNKPKATAVTKADGYAQAFTGSGTRKDRSVFTGIKPAYLMNEAELTDMYIGDGFAKVVVDFPAEECVRAGVDFEDMDEALEDKIKTRYEELNVLRHVADAYRWSRLYGGAVIVLGLNDGGQLDTPFQEDNLQKVEFLRVYNRYQAIVQTRVLDPMLDTYGNPELWQIVPYNTGAPYTVHNSRVIIMDGESIPARMKEMNLGWGLSALQACRDQLTRLGMSHQLANSLLERSQQAIHGIPNLAATLLQPGGDTLVQKRVDVVDMVRGLLNTVVIDGQETYQIAAPGISTGVNDLLSKFAEALAGVSRIPVFILMGKAAEGLNGSNSSNMEALQAQVGAWQKDNLHMPLDRITQLLAFEQSGNDGGDYKLCFKPLYVPSDKEVAETELIRAQTRKADMETLDGYVAINAMDAVEARNVIADEYDLTGKPDPLKTPVASSVAVRA